MKQPRFKKCLHCRNSPIGLVDKKVREILCQREFCKNASNYEQLRPDDTDRLLAINEYLEAQKEVRKKSIFKLT